MSKLEKTLITREQFKLMPWKNGAGVTAEIAIHPKDADFKEMNFNWRLSSAAIQDESSFSEFRGYDRLLTVLSGHGLLLNQHELGPFEFFEFEGEDKIDCVPIEGPVEDLNLIYKRDRYKGSFQLLEVVGPMSLRLEKAVHFFLPLSSVVNVSGEQVQSPDFLKIELSDISNIEINSEEYPSVILKVSLSEV